VGTAASAGAAERRVSPGGALSERPDRGGFFGGHGDDHNGGGGGALGGAIFNRTSTVIVRNSTFFNNAALAAFLSPPCSRPNTAPTRSITASDARAVKTLSSVITIEPSSDQSIQAFPKIHDPFLISPR